MNKDYIVLSFEGQRLSSLDKDKLEKILSRIASVVILNMEVDPKNVNITTLTEEELITSTISHINEKSTDVRIKKELTAEDKAIIFICTKYNKDNVNFKRREFLNDLLKSMTGSDKKLLNAVKILGNPAFTYDYIVHERTSSTENIIVKYHFTKQLYAQIRMAYDLIL